jgi:hypothetical protein
MKSIAYRGGYKYQLQEAYSLEISILPAAAVANDYIALDPQGALRIAKGYAWDGPSGPTLDTRNFMRGSLVHDALYQLMREGLLDHTIHREAADRILQSLCREDGMTALRAWWVYQGVRLFGNPASDPAQLRPVLWAPGGAGLEE